MRHTLRKGNHMVRLRKKVKKLKRRQNAFGKEAVDKSQNGSEYDESIERPEEDWDDDPSGGPDKIVIPSPS